MDIEEKIALVKKPPTCEVITEDDLREIFENFSRPKHYIGFEISGLVHLGTGLMTAMKIKDLLDAGVKPMIFFADYHSFINKKLGGDLETIRKIAHGYFKGAFLSLGLTEDNVDYVLASDVYDDGYWVNVLRIVKDTTIKRMLRCVTIMGRKLGEELSCSAIVYPAMQAADILTMDIQIAHAGMDQRKVQVLARECMDKFNKKIVLVHTTLLAGLQAKKRMGKSDEEMLELKMSKSKPDSAIFIHDSEEDIRRKIAHAFCPPKATEGNAVVDIAVNILLREGTMKIQRKREHGGDLELGREEFLRSYRAGELHPLDVKHAVAEALVGVLKPSRDYFEKHKEYLKEMKSVSISR